MTYNLDKNFDAFLLRARSYRILLDHNEACYTFAYNSTMQPPIISDNVKRPKEYRRFDNIIMQ